MSIVYVKNTPVIIANCLAGAVKYSHHVSGPSMFPRGAYNFEGFFNEHGKEGVIFDRDYEKTSFDAEYRLWKLGYKITGSVLSCADLMNRPLGGYPPTVFKLNVFKGKKQIFEGLEYCQGVGFWINVRTREKCKIPHGKTGVNETRLLARYCRPGVPTLSDVLSCLVSDASTVEDSTFGEWCDELGYNSDSVKDRSCYDSCQNTLQAIRKELPELREILKEF